MAGSAEEASARGRRVLKLDPSLMRNESYLSAHPVHSGVRGAASRGPAERVVLSRTVYGVDGNWQPANPRLIRSRARSPASPG